MANSKRNLHLQIRALCEGAVLVAAAQILSMIKILPDLPNGGSITLAALPVALYALRWGCGKGLLCAFAFGVLQLIFDGAYAWGWQSMVLDYLVAFTPLGLAGLFKRKSWGIFPGIAVGNLLRFAVHFISGVTVYRIYQPTQIPGIGVFDDAVLYSLVYNAIYVLPSMVLALAAAGILYVPMRRFLAGSDIRR